MLCCILQFFTNIFKFAWSCFVNFTLNNTILSETEDKLKHYCEELVFIWEILCNLYKIIIISRTLDINCEKNMLLSRKSTAWVQYDFPLSFNPCVITTYTSLLNTRVYSVLLIKSAVKVSITLNYPIQFFLYYTYYIQLKHTKESLEKRK